MKLNLQQAIILENERVKVEPLRPDHIPALTPVVLATPDLLQYSPPKFGTAALLETYVLNNLALREKGLKYPFAIFDKESGRYAGSTSYMNISQPDERLEIGSSWIGTAFQRTGLNRNCKFLLMQYVFETLEFERIEFKTDKRNEQSQQAIEKIGGVYEGTLRNHTRMSDGYRRDTVFYSILKKEWAGLKKTVFASIAASSDQS